jgi:hypothetical protein
MKLLFYIFRHIIPVGLIAGIGVIIFTSAVPVQSNRIDGFGVDLVGAFPGSNESVDPVLSSIQQTGAAYIRVELNWNAIEQSQDVYNWSSDRPLDLFIASAKSRGIKLVAVFTGGPGYLANLGASLDQKQLGTRWEKFIQAAVDHFGDQVDIWQIGNQVNSFYGMSALVNPSAPDATVTPDPAFYSKLLRSASKIIKTADANDQVWMGSLVSAADAGCSVNPLTYLLEVHGAKGWSSSDAITYEPRRGAVAPEYPAISNGNPCTASIPSSTDSMTAEVQSLQDLARQLGGKPVIITSLGWSADELNSMSANRAILLEQVESDLLVRASTALTGFNNIQTILWKINGGDQTASLRALKNLETELGNSKPIGQSQGQSGSVDEFRFQKGAELKIIAWRTSDGDTPYPVNISALETNRLVAYPSDTSALTPENGTALNVDNTGNTLIMLNERPVLFIGKSGSWDKQVQLSLSDQADIWKMQFQHTMNRFVNDQKAAFMQMLGDLFDKAKANAIDWGEQKLNDLLN